MTDWALNVVKIFFREEHQHLADKVIDLLRGSDKDGNKLHFDFRKIYPVPVGIKKIEDNDLLFSAKNVLQGKWPEYLGGQDKKFDMETSYSNISPRHASILENLKYNKYHYGIYHDQDWIRCAWGCKEGWGEMQCPEKDLVENYSHYSEEDGFIFVKYVFYTPWSAPTGVYKRLESFCAKYGFGMKAWVSGGDGATWNPMTGEYQNTFEEVASVDMDSMSMSDLLMISGCDLDFDLPTAEEQKITKQQAIRQMVDFL